MSRIPAAVLVAGLLVPGAMAPSAPVSAAATYTACVKKTTGKVVLLNSKSKCKKGWRKVTWSKAAPTGAPGGQGPTGAAGRFGEVIDGSGTRIGDLTGVFAVNLVVMLVRIDGADYPYLSTGQLFWGAATIYYDNAACSGTPFVATTNPNEAPWLVSNPTARVVYRPTQPSVGPATAYKYVGTAQAVTGLNRWSRDDSGVCSPDSALTGVRMPLIQVPAPADRPGPLTIR